MDFRHELVLPNEDLPFKLFVFEGKDGNYKVSKHWHRSVEIFLVLEGSIDFYINSQLYQLGQGQFILVNSNEVHSIDCPDPNFTLVLQIPGGLFEKYLGDTDNLLFRRSCKEDAALASLIQRMQEAYEKRRSGYLFQILSDFYQLMYLLVTDYRIWEVDEERRKQNKNLDRLSHITNYIRANYREELTLEGVAGIFGFSPAYLSKMFQKYAGVNYKTYLLDLRTEAGYRLLMNTELAVGEIAVECGFPDSRSFAKAFRQRYGLPPAEYRKRQFVHRKGGAIMNELTKGIRVIYQSAIRMEGEQVIYFDPYGMKEAAHDADVIFITHDHYDHFSPEDIEKVRKPDTNIVLPENMAAKAEEAGFAPDHIQAVQPKQSYKCFGLQFETVPAYNRIKPFHPKHSGWAGYVLQWQCGTYYIAGDTDATKDNQAVRCDVAFLPIGGTYTMDPKEAAKLAADIHPQIVIPIHYGCIVGKQSDAELFEKNLDSGIDCVKLMEFGE